KGCATAAASRSAILASRLAEMGMTAPAFPFEGNCGFWQQFSGQSVDIGAMGHGEYRIQSSAIKQYPSQTHTQGPISLAVELRSQVSVSDIAYIRLRTYEKAVTSAAAEPEKWAPKNRETADHSIPYLVAYAFHYGAVTPHSFSDKYLHDPSIQALTELIDVEEDPDFTVRFPNEYNCHMELITRSGERSEASVVHPKGFPDNALSDSELEGKFLSLAVDLLSTGQLNGALDVLWSLESETDLTALLDNIVVRP
ncbi:MmgE/PrpD family protein, partial [Gammaproteobacteria bacterium]|nr:MmgE/PrpD family protein [Gammaproteobacteria bacterium]